MKSKSMIITYIFSLIGGILLLIFCKQTDLFKWIVMAIGFAILIPSIVNIVTAIRESRHRDDRNIPRTGWAISTSGVIGIIFGVLLIAMPGFFAAYIIYTFAVILILCGIVQIASVSSAIKSFGIQTWLLCMPVLTLLGGFAILILGPEKLQLAATVITGILLTLYALNGLISVYNCSRPRKTIR